MSRIYRIDDGRAVRERQHALPRGTVVEAWLDVFQPGVFWVSETTKRLLLEIGARASEDGRPLWALIENKPLPDCR